MNGPAVDVLVAVPAHDEAGTVVECLQRVVAAGLAAQAGGWVDRFRVALAAHRCRDDTAARAAGYLDTAGVEHWIDVDERADSVGAVRTRLIRGAAAAGDPLDGDRTWIFSTDADTWVPADWISGILDQAMQAGADAVAGLADLARWPADDAAQAAYRRIIEDGLLPGGRHRHAYAANLAVRWSTFEAAGGFPAVAHGEETELIAAIRRAGGHVLPVRTPTVLTSARMPGRAAHGLGALLAELARG